jgi:hypothetical protein
MTPNPKPRPRAEAEIPISKTEARPAKRRKTRTPPVYPTITRPDPDWKAWREELL